MDIERLVQQPEGKTLEFKRDLSSLSPILKTLVAFANTAGGTVIVGRDDEGKIVGVEEVFEAEERLASVIADSIVPLLRVDIEVVSVKEKALLLIKVPHWLGPFYLKAKGPTEGVFIRLGSTNRIAHKEFLEELQRSKTQVAFDQLPCPEVDISGLDTEKITQIFAKIGKKIDKNKLVGLGILVPYQSTYVCSNGGVILFGKESVRERFFPNSIVRCARFLGVEKTEFLDQHDTRGSIVEAVKEVVAFIKRNTRMASKIETIQREDIPEYSSVVVREVLTNALVHADYAIKDMQPRVMIFSDRMEIESPGMFPLGYTLEEFMAGMSRVRNKVISRVFRELHMMEAWGTGYKRISAACNQGRYPMPTWTELSSAIKVSLPSHFEVSGGMERSPVIKSTLTSRQEEIVALFNEGESMTTKEMFVRLEKNISERTLRADLAELKAKGIMKMVGSGPNTEWRLA